MTVSRSGQIRNPHMVTSSPVLPMTVTSCPRLRRPMRKRAPPIPPARTVTCTRRIVAAVRRLLRAGFAPAAAASSGSVPLP